VEPGLIGGEVNRLLASYAKRHKLADKYKIGPDPSSIDSCMMGGIVANNSSGMCCGVAQARAARACDRVRAAWHPRRVALRLRHKRVRGPARVARCHARAPPARALTCARAPRRSLLLRLRRRAAAL
jgi:FAD/FMN-containing dehydrogenase